LITILISIIAVGFLPLVVDAAHPPGSETVSSPVVIGSNIVSFRDSTNIMLQSSTISLDTSSVKAGFVTIIVQEKDANLDSSGIDVVLSSATSTSSGSEKATVELSETSEDSGTFSGKLFVSTSGPTSGDTLELGLGDAISVFYDPEPLSVGRFSAEIDVTSGSGTVVLSEEIIEKKSDVACPAVLFTHPVEVSLSPGVSASSISTTLQFANSSPGNNKFFTTEMLYKPPGSPFWESLTPQGAVFGPPFFQDNSKHDFDAMTISNVLQPSTGIIEGQYALGFLSGGCSGGGGGGLVRPGLVVNALAGAGSIIGLFTGGSGGGANPTFGDASFLVLENVSEAGFGGVISEGDDISLDSTKVVETGDTAVLRFELYENQGITNLERFKMFLNFQGENYAASTIDTHITYKRGGEITIVDPHEKIEKAEIEILQVDPWNLIVNVKIIFKNTFNTSILVDSWDLDRNSGKKLFPDVLQVVEPSILLADAQKVLNEPTPDLTSQVLTETELTEIPVWIKSNALWWKQKQIDDSDFMAGIKYLIEKTMIEVDQNDLSNSLTTKEIPVWISDVAGMWADDSITDEEFINIMQWLISKGILQVQQ